MRPALMIALALLFLPLPARAAEPASAACTEIAAAAQDTALAPAFLARVLWDAGPETPADTIRATATTLATLIQRHGNPGLAALAFKGGAAQAETFLRGKGVPPATVDFVILTTGQMPEVWRDTPPASPEFRLSPDGDFASACVELIKGRWGEPLPELAPLPEPEIIDLALFDPANRSLRPKIRPKPTLAKWGAQLAFGDSQDRARANFTRATSACRASVGDTPDIIFVENRVRGRDGYWMARVSRMDRDDADDICTKARARGCSCAVYKNY
ncbi:MULTISPECIES: hypothetical protein [unclassified Marinovum]